MQYARYGKPTGTSMVAIKKSMKGKGKLPPFVPLYRSIPMKALNPIARLELKYLDTSISTLIDSTTEVINNSLNLAVQGDGGTNRDGNIIIVKSIQIQGRLAQVPAAAATSAPIVYIWLVLDRQPEGGAVSVAGAANSYLTGTVTEPQGLLPLPPNQWMYKTIKKWAIPLTSTAGVTTAYNNVSCNFSYYKEFKKGLEIRFSGNAGTIADVMSNNLALVAGCADTDDTVSFNGQARIRFTG